MTRQMAVTFDEQLAEVEREIAIRKRFYPRWVTDSRISQADAERQLARLLAVRDTLLALKQYRNAIPLAFTSLRTVETSI
jgi:hypothetical protein